MSKKKRKKIDAAALVPIVYFADVGQTWALHVQRTEHGWSARRSDVPYYVMHMLPEWSERYANPVGSWIWKYKVYHEFNTPEAAVRAARKVVHTEEWVI